MNHPIFFILTLIIATSCNFTLQEPKAILPETFEGNIDGKSISLYTLKNDNGMMVELTNYGARIVSIWVKDKDGNFKDVIWGHATLEQYINTPVRYANPIIGRYANRINKGKFTLNGKDYQLSVNSGSNHLHGGHNGIEAKVWDAVMINNGRSIKMSCQLADAEEGYPGNMVISVTYTLNDDNALILDYEATTDAPTIINLTTHAMFNLSGSTSNDVLNYKLKIDAADFLVMNEEGIPTGEVRSIKDSPLNFLNFHIIGESIDADDILITQAKGYDHCFVFDTTRNMQKSVAEVICPESGIKMSVTTDQPSMQLYTGNYFSGNVTGKRGDKNNYRSIIALEAQSFPDAPNHPQFPSAELKPGETYTQHTAYQFSIEN